MNRRSQLEQEYWACMAQLEHAHDEASVRRLRARCDEIAMEYGELLGPRHALRNEGQPSPKPRRVVRYIATCKACKTATSTVADAEPGYIGAKLELDPPPYYAKDVQTGTLQTAHGNLYMPCRKCGQLRRAHAVLGRYSSTKKCSARCRNATGFDCECQCAGLNHGRGFDPSEG